MSIPSFIDRWCPDQDSIKRWSRVGFSLLPWLLLVLQSYIAFTFPLKQDRYNHSFFGHVPDRLAAYRYLMSSPLKFKNKEMEIERIGQIIQDTARRYDVEGCLIHAIVMYESGYQVNTITTTGAMGLMALMPGTARRLGVNDPFEAGGNIDGGTRLIHERLATFRGNVALTLAAYNAGGNAVKMFNGIPPYKETVDYVKHVTHIYNVCKLEEEQG